MRWPAIFGLWFVWICVVAPSVLLSVGARLFGFGADKGLDVAADIRDLIRDLEAD